MCQYQFDRVTTNEVNNSNCLLHFQYTLWGWNGYNYDTSRQGTAEYLNLEESCKNIATYIGPKGEECGACYHASTNWDQHYLDCNSATCTFDAFNVASRDSETDRSTCATRITYVYDNRASYASINTFADACAQVASERSECSNCAPD
jgi:hypothetical protein